MERNVNCYFKSFNAINSWNIKDFLVIFQMKLSNQLNNKLETNFISYNIILNNMII